jgi:hypothetical protein
VTSLPAGASAILDAIRAGDRGAALAGIAALDAGQRRQLAPEIRRLYGEVRAPGAKAEDEAAYACIVVVTTASELVRDYVFLHHAELLLPAVAAVRPLWLDEASLRKLMDSNKLDWRVLVALAEAGVCPLPTSDWTLEPLIEQLGQRGPTPLLDDLRQQRLPESGTLYRLFDVEGGPQSSFAASDKYRSEQNTWAVALAELAATGELDRARLLDASLQALARDYPAFRAGWFARFHDRLAPSTDERAARIPTYLRLLGSSIPATVAFATKIVEGLSKQGRIEPGQLLVALPTVLRARQKGTVVRAAALLRASLKRAPETAPAIVDLALDALAHPEVDAQRALLDLIDAARTAPDVETQRVDERLAACRDLVAPSLRARLPAGSGVQPGAEDAAHATVATPARPQVAERRVELASSTEEALEMVAHALEHEGDAIAQEQAIDAIARHAPAPDDWDGLSGPLRKRAAALLRRQFAFRQHFAQSVLAYLALAWTTGAKPFPPLPGDLASLELELYFRRVDSVADRVVEDLSLPLLSTPTRPSGAVDLPQVMARLAAWRAAGREPDLHDAVLALTRLPPDERCTLRAALDVPHPALDLAAEAGGIDVVPRIGSRQWPAITHYHIELEPRPPLPESCLEHRRALLHLPVSFWDRTMVRGEVSEEAMLTRWLATTTPHDPELHFSMGLRRLGGELDDPLATATHLERARDPSVTLGKLGHWLLLLALAARGARAVEVGLDVAIDGIEQGRVDAELLGEVLADLLPSGMIKAKRLATTLAQVAQASPRHAATVALVIARGLRGPPEKAPRDVASLLSLLHELLIASAARLEDAAAREWLERLPGGGKASTLRKALLGSGRSPG